MPAIAIGRALVARGHDASTIHFVGSARGIEARMVPAAGFSSTLLPGRGIARRLTVDNIGAALGLLGALVKAIVLLGRLRPAVLVAVGGYASAPAVLAAAIWRTPLIVAEQNAVPGLANRMAGRLAKASAVSFEGTPLRRAVMTGNPVRREIVDVDTSPAGKTAACRQLGIPPGASVVMVAGGSLGARRINDATVELARSWAGTPGVCIRHVTGSRDFEAVSNLRPAPVDGGLTYQQVEFEDRMDLLLAAADVAVTRAGASTVAELTVVGIPSVLVPLPGAPGDHQTENARRLSDAGAAVVVPDSELDVERLAAEVDRLLADRAQRDRMREAARRLGRPGAADAVAALAEQYARG
ncbi:MAG: undecaprenyldiphospho-muramoylpentapeptide beta-N-acetylglucosaminyltransferase [Acidimicrobiales bacterium]|nr:undecaprenyldiphospho-muramoylpentapeptide beta-N-acetylglucosaminyltransferase [Acidimicrobiales bacterium]